MGGKPGVITILKTELKQTSKQNLAEWSGIRTKDLWVTSLVIWAIQPYNGADPILTNIFAMGVSQKPYNLTGRVTKDHNQFHWYNTTQKAKR